VALDVLQRPKPVVEVISVLRGKGVVGLSVGNIIVKCMAENAAKQDLGAEMDFHAVECTSGNLTVPPSMVPVVPPDTSANLEAGVWSV
jgi:hypothetical protein